jgi:hypothetical protein
MNPEFKKWLTEQQYYSRAGLLSHSWVRVLQEKTYAAGWIIGRSSQE